MYVLFNLCCLNIGVRELVIWFEECIIDMLKDYDIDVYVKVDVLGVYVNDSKVVLLGLWVCCGCLFYGLVLNVNMDLSLFLCINLCGYVGMNMV